MLSALNLLPSPAVVAMLFEKDAIALTRAVPGGPPALAIASRLPRFAENYTLQIALRCAHQQLQQALLAVA